MQLILGLVYLTSPSFAQSPQVIITTNANSSLENYNYLPPVPKPVEPVFELISETNQTMEWPQVVGNSVNAIMLGPVCIIIVVTIAIIVLGIVIYITYKMLQCLDNMLNPTNNDGGEGDKSYLMKAPESFTPIKQWVLPNTNINIITTTNMADWYPSCYTITNIFQQESNYNINLGYSYGACRFITMVYDGSTLVSAVITPVNFSTFGNETNAFGMITNNYSTGTISSTITIPIYTTNYGMQFFNAGVTNDNMPY